MNVQLTFLADLFSNEMIIKVCSFNGDIDVFGMY